MSKLLRSLWSALLMLVPFASTQAQVAAVEIPSKVDNEDILSKDDARAMFAMSMQQWTANVANAVKQGVAKATQGSTGLGMAMNTAGGHLLVVKPDFANGTDRPTMVQVTVGYRPPYSHALTDTMVKDVIERAKQQLAPEYSVFGQSDRLPDGLAIFFMITEANRTN